MIPDQPTFDGPVQDLPEPGVHTSRKKLRRLIRAKRTPAEQVRFNYRERRCGSCRRCPFGTTGNGTPCAWRGGLFTGELFPSRIGATIRVVRLPQFPDSMTYVVAVDKLEQPLYHVQEGKEPELLRSAEENTLRQLELVTQGWVSCIAMSEVIVLWHGDKIAGVFSGDKTKHLMAEMQAEGYQLPILKDEGTVVAE